jgi:hypothetical protein
MKIFLEKQTRNFCCSFQKVCNSNATKVNDFKMYYAMQMYFANGGGPCYIVSVGDYTISVAVGLPTTEETLLYGLELLKKEDEPTLIVFPDLQSLVPAAADVAAAQAVVPVASYHESVATKAKEAALLQMLLQVQM